MNFEIESPSLKAALSLIGKAVNAGSRLKAFLCVLFEVEGRTVTLTTSDLECSYSVTLEIIETLISEPGRCCVPYKTLAEIVSKLPGAPISLTLIRDRVALKCGRAKFDLPTQPVDEFPGALEVHQERVHTMVPSTLVTMINLLAAIPSKDEQKVALACLHVRANAGLLQVLATDGRRLGFAQVADQVVPDFHFLAHIDHMRELARILKNAKDADELRWWRHQNMMCFEFNSKVLYAFRLTEGDFPDVDRVRPAEDAFQTEVRVGREQLAGALARMLVVAAEKSAPNLVDFQITAGALKLYARTPDVGFAEEELACVVTGRDLDISFNGQYLLDFIKVLSTEEIEIHLQDPVRSAMMRPYNGDGGGPDVSILHDHNTTLTAFAQICGMHLSMVTKGVSGRYKMSDEATARVEAGLERVRNGSREVKIEVFREADNSGPMPRGILPQPLDETVHESVEQKLKRLELLEHRQDILLQNLTTIEARVELLTQSLDAPIGAGDLVRSKDLKHLEQAVAGAHNGIQNAHSRITEQAKRVGYLAQRIGEGDRKDDIDALRAFEQRGTEFYQRCPALFRAAIERITKGAK